MRQMVRASVAGLATLMLATGAVAAKPPKPTPTPTATPAPSDPKPDFGTLGPSSCAAQGFSVTVKACSGWYYGNLNSGKDEARDASAAALTTLLNPPTPFTGPGLSFLEGLESLKTNTIDFSRPLYGDTVLAVHVGAAKGEPLGVGYQGTAFFLIDAGNLVGGLDKLTFKGAGLSNARLYSTDTWRPVDGVPEPATWALMIMGFGAIGATLRRRRAAGAAPLTA